jgi:hypothetical protein
MPKRSNDYQRLVYLVKSHVSVGATVTESKFLKDLVSGEDREVDIVIEANVGGHPMVLSIECIDRSRRAGKSWVEEMHSKHERLPTSKLVLASRAGFFEPALRKAASWGHETLSFANVSERMLGSFLAGFTDVHTTMVSLTPGTTEIEVADSYGNLFITEIDSKTIIFDEAGKPLSTIGNAVELIFNSNSSAAPILDSATPESKYFKVVSDYSGQRLCVRHGSTGQVFELRKIVVIGGVEQDSAHFPVEHVEVGDVEALWGKSSFLSGDATVIMTHQNGIPKISLDVRYSKSKESKGE